MQFTAYILHKYTYAIGRPGNALASPGRLDGELIRATVARAVKALDGAIKAYEKPPEKSGGCTMNVWLL
jgi:hypothetical protein